MLTMVAMAIGVKSRPSRPSKASRGKNTQMMMTVA